MAVILQPAFFAPIIQYVVMANAKEVVFEKHDNFQKQTYRNRCYIYGANGKQLLTVPILHTKSSSRQLTKDVRIDNSHPWRKIIVKSLESSYRSSPYFEFYEDDLMEVFNKDHVFLLDLNLLALEKMRDCLQIENSLQFTENYDLVPEKVRDYRHLAVAKNEPVYALQAYKQVFDEKLGYLVNLSILDLLFNEGPNALGYLEAHGKLIIPLRGSSA